MQRKFSTMMCRLSYLTNIEITQPRQIVESIITASYFYQFYPDFKDPKQQLNSNYSLLHEPPEPELARIASLFQLQLFTPQFQPQSAAIVTYMNNNFNALIPSCDHSIPLHQKAVLGLIYSLFRSKIGEFANIPFKDKLQLFSFMLKDLKTVSVFRSTPVVVPMYVLSSDVVQYYQLIVELLSIISFEQKQHFFFDFKRIRTAKTNVNSLENNMYKQFMVTEQTQRNINVIKEIEERCKSRGIIQPKQPIFKYIHLTQAQINNLMVQKLKQINKIQRTKTELFQKGYYLSIIQQEMTIQLIELKNKIQAIQIK
ncbi:Hypothetical_protein [Hexamita inflata]|uniref:Hypothetical_protein n=2 Tax=Hexamita inflata TaxID=28002 RepID=A0AA86VEN9_9EUKA|nr:Hypothetical protein HINF_LOCUS52128 [Hexamita inflata]